MDEAQAALAAVQGEAASLQCRAEVVAKATKDVRKTLTLLAELETEVLRLKKVHKDAKAKLAAKEEKLVELADLQSQVERMERRVKAADEKLAEQKHSAYVKQEATQRANQALREELQNSQNELDRVRGAQKDAAARMGAIKSEVSARGARAANAAAACVAFHPLAASATPGNPPPPPRPHTLIAQHDRIQAQHNSEMAEMVAAMRNIQKSVTDYHSRLFVTMADVGGGHGYSGGDGI